MSKNGNVPVISDPSDDDERLTNDVDRGARAGQDPAREDRAMDDRARTENRQLTDEDRLREFQSQFFKEVLPDLPRIPGYHTCWLTTTNSRDSIPQRIRMGYEPVKPEEVPGYEYATLKTGEWAGYIGVNEMLAFKLPLSLYNMYMKEAHHDAPAREQSKLTDVVDNIREGARAKGGEVLEYEGMAELRRDRRRSPASFEG